MEGMQALTTFITSLGLPTALVMVLLWYQWKRDQINDAKQKEQEQRTIDRENRMADRILELETLVNKELIAIVRNSTECQMKISASLSAFADQIDRYFANNPPAKETGK